MFRSGFFANRFNACNCCMHVAFDSILQRLALNKRIFLSLGKHKSCPDGAECELFIPGSRIPPLAMPAQGKRKKYQHGQLLDKPFLCFTPKSRAELNPMTESF